MWKFSILSPAEQVANHLRNGIQRGIWSGEMPGAPKLAAGLGIDPKTVLAALTLLEHEGLLVSRGVGRPRRINAPEGFQTASMRIAILIFDPLGLSDGHVIELQHMLQEAGFTAMFSEKSLTDLRSDVNRVARMVKRTNADAWVVVSGSQEVLEWFCGQAVPVFALFGRQSGLPLAGTRPEKLPAYDAAIDKLVAMGHRRIALLARKMRRLPTPGRTESGFLRRLRHHGIRTGAFNLPDWDDDMDGFQVLLTELFRVTPPTALIIQEAFLFIATQNFLSGRGLRVPEDVSLVCSDASPAFVWCVPRVAHIRWDSRPVLRRVVRWAENVARGRKDRRQTLTKAEFVEGGTISLAKR